MGASKQALIILAVGGSGGHLFPAKHLAKDLIKEGYDVLFMGSGLSKSAFFNTEEFHFIEVESASIVHKNPLKVLKGLVSMVRGSLHSYKVLIKKKPLATVGFGSYHSFPILVMSRFLNIPYALFAADSVLGRVIRLMGKKALFVGQTFLCERKYPRLPSVIVKLPSHMHRIDKKQALEYYSLDRDKLTLLIFGGSQGAKAINQMILKAMEHIQVPTDSIQVLHLIGHNSSKELIEMMYQRLKIKHHVKVFEDKMMYAWSLADLVIARSGASTIMEQLFFHVPAIYIPYPYAADDHQLHNALYVDKHFKAATCLIEKEVTPEKLAFAIDKYLKNPYDMQVIKKRLEANEVFHAIPPFSKTLIHMLKQGKFL